MSRMLDNKVVWWIGSLVFGWILLVTLAILYQMNHEFGTGASAVVGPIYGGYLFFLAIASTF